MKKNAEELLIATNKLQPNLQLSSGQANEKGNLAFLDINFNVDLRKKCNFWVVYKPSDKGLSSLADIFAFSSCIHFFYKKNRKKKQFKEAIHFRIKLKRP